MEQTIDIPPPGALAARGYPFHVAYDNELLPLSGKARFFMNHEKYADGSEKAFPEACNVQTKGYFPQGQMKHVRAISIFVEGAEEESFEVSLILAVAPVFTKTMKTGEINRYVLEGKGYTLLPLEQFCVEIDVPEKFRGKWAQVRLYGPFAKAIT